MCDGAWGRQIAISDNVRLGTEQTTVAEKGFDPIIIRSEADMQRRSLLASFLINLSNSSQASSAVCCNGNCLPGSAAGISALASHTLSCLCPNEVTNSRVASLQITTPADSNSIPDRRQGTLKGSGTGFATRNRSIRVWLFQTAYQIALQRNTAVKRNPRPHTPQWIRPRTMFRRNGASSRTISMMSQVWGLLQSQTMVHLPRQSRLSRAIRFLPTIPLKHP